jgi:hypothetical protein
MKTLLASLAVLTAFVATPALAAPGDYDRGGPTYQRNDDLRGGPAYDRNAYDRNDGRYGDFNRGGGFDRGDLIRLDAMIDRGMRNRTIDWREARMLKSDLREVRELQARFYRTGGMDNRERAILDRRVDRLRAAIYRQSNDRDGRYYNGAWR